MAGIFISFEGIDGAGKSSHIEAMAAAFRSQAAASMTKRGVVLTREPGGTALAERLREMILHEPMDPLTEALLVFAARREHIVQVIVPALARGDIVLCDRFTDASFAYQGAGRRFSWEMLSKLEHAAQDLNGLEADFLLNSGSPIDPSTSIGSGAKSRLLQPNLTLLFEVPPAVAAQRLAAARQPDKFESQDVAFFERVSAGYADRVAADPLRFVRINGHQSLDQVRSDVLAALQSHGFLHEVLT